MAIKDILVHIDGTRASANRLTTALNMARIHDAHLTGLYVIPHYAIPPYAEVQIGAEILAAQREAGMQQARRLEKTFQEILEGSGVSYEWRAVEGDLVNCLTLHGRYVDLVVVGQADSDDPESVDAATTDHMVLEVGRPVLFVPYIGAPKVVGEHIMVAWNATREAVRAVADAMPLLQRARRVEVVSVNPPRGSAGEGDVPGADICLHLARHGVRAEAHQIVVSDIDVGNLLLSRAADEEVDLMVMGAYGHSRFRELVFGGATRHLLDHMTVPVLMAH